MSAHEDTNFRTYAEYKLRIKSQMNGKDLERTGKPIYGFFFYCINIRILSGLEFFFDLDYFFFFPFLQLIICSHCLDDIKDSSKGYLVKDTLIVEAEVTRISTVNDFSSK